MQTEVTRLHYMDSMRAVLMILGVVLHSAHVFNPEKSWLIYSENNSILMEYIVNSISTFRMPAFFVVSGFFTQMTLSRHDPKVFVQARAKRIIIPFIVTAVTLNSLQTILLHWGGWRQFEIVNYLLHGEYISHLWFLINLFFYYAISGIFTLYFSSILKAIGKLANTFLSAAPMIVTLLLLPIISVGVFGLNSLGFPLYSVYGGLIDIHSIMMYLPYFIFGILLGANKDTLANFSTTNPLACILIVALSFLLKIKISETNNELYSYGTPYLEALTTWASVALCFNLFFRFFKKYSSSMRFLADSSYSVYLFHHFFVIALGAFLVSIDCPAILGAITLISCVCFITLFIHVYFIEKSKHMRLLYNGK